VLAIPVIAGEKPESERFPGAEITLSIEAMMQDGKALQSGTSHYLGQNFSAAMEMEFTDEYGERELCYTTSWGVSTRMMGAVVMTHGDDNGLRVPPRVAPRQVRIVPITRDEPTAVLEAARELQAEIAAQDWEGAQVRAEVDTRERKPAEKRWEWIRKGVPLVIELGPRDIDDGVVSAFRRDAAEVSAEQIVRRDFIAGIETTLVEIQSAYLDASRKRLEEQTATDISDLDAFRDWFSAGEGGEMAKGFVRAPWSEDPETEAVLDELKVSVRCIPFDQNLEDGAACVISGKPAKVEAVFAKAY
jgi:prolyl-tRNA synthetase